MSDQSRALPDVNSHVHISEGFLSVTLFKKGSLPVTVTFQNHSSGNIGLCVKGKMVSCTTISEWTCKELSEFLDGKV